MNATDSRPCPSPPAPTVFVGRLCFESAARASDFFMNSLNFKLVLNWPQLLCPTSVCACVCVWSVWNLARTSWCCWPQQLSGNTHLYKARVWPVQARPGLLGQANNINNTHFVPPVADAAAADGGAGQLPPLAKRQLQRQLQRHLLFVFIKKILQRQHEINTEAKVHARTGTRTRSISCSCSCKLHTQTHKATHHAFCFTAAFLMGVTDCDCCSRQSPSSVRLPLSLFLCLSVPVQDMCNVPFVSGA